MAPATAGLTCALAAAAFAAMVPAHADPAGCQRGSDVRERIAALAGASGSQVQTTVARIEGVGRQLLALRSYLRAPARVAERWSWSQSEIDTWRESDEYRDLLAEVERIRTRFERDNPGYTLYANTDVRSLDVQIERWNENRSVGEIAGDLYAAACTANIRGRDDFRRFLIDWQPPRPAPLAAPGLSQHGRARAIDFQIQQGNRIVASTDTSQIDSAWEAGGWSRKLNAAIEAASTRFRGPLTAPNEPWHYEYRPE